MKKTARVIALLPALFFAASAFVAEGQVPAKCSKAKGRLAELTGTYPGLFDSHTEVKSEFYKVRQAGKHGASSVIAVKKLDDEQTAWKKNINNKCCLILSAGGRTALMYESRYGTAEIIRALISYGANIHYRDSKGDTSYNYLTKNKNYDRKKDGTGPAVAGQLTRVGTYDIQDQSSA